MERISETYAEARWDALPGAAGYVVRLNGSERATTTGTAVGFSGLDTGTAYEVAVSARDAAGIEGDRALVTFTTLGPSSALPAPTGLHMVYVNTESALAEWNAVDGAASYIFRLNGVEMGACACTSTNFVNLTPGVTYTLTVNARTQAGTEGLAAQITFVTPLPAPTNLHMVRVFDTYAEVGWDTVPGANDYVLYVNGSRQTFTSDPRMGIGSLDAGTTYEVTVAARDAAGNEGLLGRITFTTTGQKAVLTAPANLHMDYISQTLASFSWDPVPGASSYLWKLNGVDSGASAGTSGFVSPLTPGTTYDLVVVARTANGTEGTAAHITFTTAP
jgi:chitodextrinase